MECARLKKLAFFVVIEEKSPYWICMVFIQVTDITFGLDFCKTFKTIDPHIGHMEILLTLIIQSKTPNSIMTQTNNILCGATHQS